MKRIVSILLLSCLVALAIVACGGSTSNSGGSTPQVHTNEQSFEQSSITIQKGQTITLMNDSSVPHIIQNGSWNNGVAKTLQESGAPTINVPLSGNSQQVIGPFPTAGTYHIYCTIHSGMNLTVTVQ